MRQKILALVVASCAALSLVACDAVPDSGPVREGLTSLAQLERGSFINPQGPTAGADQESIVRGFVRAATSHLNDYEIAREFLAPTYAEQWDPNSGALVYEGAQQYESPEEGIAVLSLKALANVDAIGSMLPADPGEQVDARFELTKVGGEWRISSAPNGIIIDRSTFLALWEPRDLYFLSPDQRLVSELRWVISRSALVPIVRGLIGGPSEGMIGAISTAFPEGTSLTGSSIPVVDGAAVIDMSSELFDVDEATISSIKRQLGASLQGLAGVTRFQISVHGSVIGGGELSISEELSVGDVQKTVVLKDGDFGVASGNTLKPLAGLSERVAGLSPLAATVSPDLSAVAVLHSGGISWVTKDQSIAIDNRRDLLSPSVDQLGYVWAYTPANPEEIWVTKPGVEASKLPLPWLDDYSVRAVRVSLGGNRLAVLVAVDGGSEVIGVGVVRDESGAPVGFTAVPTVQHHDQGAPVDLDWIGDNRFALLSETGLLGGSAKVTIVAISGRFPVEYGAVSGGASISGGGSSRALLRVLDDQHRLFRPQGTGWQQLMAGVDLLAKIG